MALEKSPLDEGFISDAELTAIVILVIICMLRGAIGTQRVTVGT